MNNYVMLLKAARVKIASGKEKFLCYALKSAAEESLDADMKTIASKMVKSIMAEITARNQYIFTVDSWLRENSGDYRAWQQTARNNYTEYSRVMKEYRLRWIDALIAEYQKLK